MTYFAITLDQPINVQGIQLTPEQGRILFGVLACLSPISLVLLTWMLVVSFTSQRRVALSATSILLPKPTRIGLSTDEIEIPFEQIYHAEVRPFMGSTQLLRLEHQHGVVSIPSNMFADKQHFATLSELVLKTIATLKAAQTLQNIEEDA